MNKHYKEIADVVIPAHDGEESLTTLHIFDVTDEKANELYDIGYPTERSEWNALAVADAIREDLMAYDDGGVAPGAPFHRYSARFGFPHTVYLLDTLAYNV